MGGFLLNFTRILWFSWDLGHMLFDIPEDETFAEILGFSNISGFPAVNWTPKCTETVSVGCIPFEQKYKILKDLSTTLSCWRLALVKISEDRTLFSQ